MSDFVVPIRPRYSEVDAMGVVYHANYLVYFDVGRTEWLRAAGADYAALERRGFRLAVLDLDVRYLAPARFDQELALAVCCERVGGASVSFRYALRDAAGVLLAEGHTRLGCLDTSNRPVRLPRDTRAVLARGSRAAAAASEGP